MPSLAVDPNSYDPSTILVRFQDDLTAPTALRLVNGTQLERSIRLVNGLTEIRLGANVRLEDALAAYRADPTVVYAEPNFHVHLDLTPNDPRYGSMWDLNNTGQNGGTPD